MLAWHVDRNARVMGDHSPARRTLTLASAASRRTETFRAILLGGAFSVVLGCGGGAQGNVDPAAIGAQSQASEPIATTCARTVEAMNGRRCNDDLFCTVPISCGAFEQQTRCTCTEGRFACVDATGPIARGHEPRCVDDPPPDETPCPETLDDAHGASCGTIGRLCFYEGALCPERPVRNLDSCRCVRRDGGPLRFECTVVGCNPMAAP